MWGASTRWTARWSRSWADSLHRQRSGLGQCKREFNRRMKRRFQEWREKFENASARSNHPDADFPTGRVASHFRIGATGGRLASRQNCPYGEEASAAALVAVMCARLETMAEGLPAAASSLFSAGIPGYSGDGRISESRMCWAA